MSEIQELFLMGICVGAVLLAAVLVALCAVVTGGREIPPGAGQGRR